jgi:DNA invertase Pin-like site-specific DNA recombinase
MKLWGYVRVSTDDQNNSSQDQQARIAEAARQRGQIACVCVDEDVTGKMPLRNRPQGRLLWDGLERGDTVLFVKHDRAFRSLRDAADTVHIWLEKGITPVFLNLGLDLGRPEGRLFFHQLASFAEFERELISQRVRDTVAYLKSQNRPHGNRPFGWKRSHAGKGATFVPFDQERELGMAVVNLHASGMSYREIALHLMRERVTKPGKRWTDPKGAFYLTSDVHALALATRQGFPIVARASLRASDSPAQPSGC